MSLWEPLTGRTMIRRGFQTPDEEAVLPINKDYEADPHLKAIQANGFSIKGLHQMQGLSNDEGEK